MTELMQKILSKFNLKFKSCVIDNETTYLIIEMFILQIHNDLKKMNISFLSISRNCLQVSRFSSLEPE